MSALPDDPSAEEPWLERQAALDGQAAAALPRANAWVEANAGSGKTKVLIDRVARLLLEGAEPDSITCVTYTKAAASEMQSRLFGVLGGWCVMAPEKLRKALSDLERREQDSFADEELGRARELFAKALETPGGLRIETIHAFCGRVLRRFPLEAGVAPGFQELDDEASAELWDDAIRTLGAKVARGSQELKAAARCVVEAGGSSMELLHDLDAKRAAVSGFIGGDIDGAVARLKSELGAPDESADAIVESAMGEQLPRGQLKTVAAMLPGVARSDIELARLLGVVLSDAPAADRYAAYRGIAFTGGGDERKSNCYTAEAAKVAPALAALFQMKDTPQGSEALRILAMDEALAARRIYERSAALLRLAQIVFRDFERRKQARAGLDFDDLINTVARLLTREHAAEWVLWKLDGGAAHVLLDEAQDTSPAQWEILQQLTSDIFSGTGVERERPRTLFVVGDEKQSIYSFQGADPEAFLDMGRRIRQAADDAGATFEAPRLAMSFRSVKEVLGYVDEVFDPTRFAPLAPFSVQVPDEAAYAPHASHRREEWGCVELWPLEQPAAVDDPDPWDAPVDQQTAASPVVKLAKQIASFVRREIDTGSSVWEGKQQRPCNPGDFLILVKRRTGGLFDAILQQLKSLNLPVAGADRIQLLESLAVQDLLNLMRFALCPEDDLVLAEALKGPFGGLDDDDLLALAYDRKGSLWAEVQRATLPHVVRTRALLAALIARRSLPPFEFLTRALEVATGHDKPGWELILSRFGEPAREPVTALVDRAAKFDAASPASLELFLAAVEHHGGEVKRELSGPQGEVRVMTVHGAKGLQAPVVILPDTTAPAKYERNGLFVAAEGAPVWVGPKGGDTPETAVMRADADARALREHRRLLYVALTRAQDRLLICGSWSGRTKTGSDKESWYQLCLNGMNGMVQRGLAREVEQDGRKFFRLGEAPDLLLPAIDARTPPPAPDWIRKAVPEEAATQRILTPSALSAKPPPPLAPFGQKREQRLRRGRLIHKLLESLPEVAPKSRRKAAREFLARQQELTQAERDEMLAATFRVLEDLQFAAVFDPGGRAEAPVIGKLGADIINGRVDRLVVTPDEILIVDFKTDRPAPDAVSGVGEAYLDQMNAYSTVLAQAWPGRRVRRLLVWTDGPKLMEI